jgi:hypothetical protein
MGLIRSVGSWEMFDYPLIEMQKMAKTLVEKAMQNFVNKG